MKKLIQTSFILAILFFSCAQTNKVSKSNALKKTNTQIEKITLNPYTRGYNSLIEYTANGISKDNTLSTKLSDEKWSEIIQLCDFNVADLKEFDSDSKLRFSDSSMSCKLFIKTNDSVYQSKEFDLDNAPEEIKPLVDLLNKYRIKNKL